MMHSPPRKNNILRWLERVLWLAGVTGIAVWGASILASMVWQDWGNWAFDHQRRGETATVNGYVMGRFDEFERRVEAWIGIAPVANGPAAPVPPQVPDTPPSGPVPRAPALAENALIGRLTIPRLHLSAIVREGDGRQTLSLAVGHIPGTALPGQEGGNVAVAGHRDTFFLGLKDIRANDVVEFETVEGSHQYQVESTQIVKPRDVGVLSPTGHSELTLVTCYPFYYIGSAPDRFIVKAREIVNAREARADGVKPGAVNAGALKAGEVQAREVSAGPSDVLAKNSRGNLPEALPADGDSEEPAAESSGVVGTLKVNFDIGRNHSRTLAPGISLGIESTSPSDQRATGWMWLMPDRRTIWLRNQRTREPVVFYDDRDGMKRELVITSVTDTSASGYLLLSEE
jgi:sortase A